MIRALIERDQLPLRDCAGRWVRQDRQPYYELEKNFTNQKGLKKRNLKETSGKKYPFRYYSKHIF